MYGTMCFGVAVHRKRFIVYGLLNLYTNSRFLSTGIAAMGDETAARCPGWGKNGRKVPYLATRNNISFQDIANGGGSDKVRREFNLSGAALAGGDTFEQKFRRKLSHLLGRLGDARDGWRKIIHIYIVVEGNNRDVIRDGQPCFTNGLHGPEHNGVAHCKDGRRTVCTIEQQLGLEITILRGKFITYYYGIIFQAGFIQSRKIARHSLLVRH